MTAKLHPLALALLLAVAAGPALAKLPAPSEEAKAKAAETKAKADHGAKLAGYQLCLSQDRVAEAYRAAAKAAGKTTPEPVATPACADPGAFSPVALAAGAPAAAPATPAAAASPKPAK